MNRKDMAREITRITGIPISHVDTVLRGFCSLLRLALDEGEDVNLYGVGKFKWETRTVGTKKRRLFGRAGKPIPIKRRFVVFRLAQGIGRSTRPLKKKEKN